MRFGSGSTLLHTAAMPAQPHSAYVSSQIQRKISFFLQSALNTHTPSTPGPFSQIKTLPLVNQNHSPSRPQLKFENGKSQPEQQKPRSKFLPPTTLQPPPTSLSSRTSSTTSSGSSHRPNFPDPNDFFHQHTTKFTKCCKRKYCQSWW